MGTSHNLTSHGDDDVVLMHLQERFWVMSCSAAYELAERSGEAFPHAHKAARSIAQKVS
jgi:hypothetical protein